MQSQYPWMRMGEENKAFLIEHNPDILPALTKIARAKTVAAIDAALTKYLKLYEGKRWREAIIEDATDEARYYAELRDASKANARRTRNRKARKESRKIKVNAYLINLAYGGPEEGGWWYQCGEPVPSEQRHETFFNRQNAINRASALNAWAERIINKPRGSRGNLGSVLCEGELRFHVENHEPRYFPHERPHYE